MRVAVINEVSASGKNPEILAALEEIEGIEVVNAGMTKPEESPELTYIQTGLMAALALNTKAADFVVGGCGTGQGFLNSVMQYPGVFCGLASQPLDAWLYSRINGGNCVSLVLNKGYGWAGGINLKFIIRELFSGEQGSGYPPERQESQINSRLVLNEISQKTHRGMSEILSSMDPELLAPIGKASRFIKLLRDADNEAASAAAQLLEEAGRRYNG